MAGPLIPPGSPERRTDRRYEAIEQHGVVAGRVRPGFSVLVLDISAGGIYVETACRLLPGAWVDMQLHGRDQRTDIRGRVLRCAVARLTSEGVRYRGAIRFERQLPWLVPDERGYGFPTENSRPHHQFGEEPTQTLL